MKQVNEKKSFLLNHKGRKYRANTLVGLVWKFLTKSE